MVDYKHEFNYGKEEKGLRVLDRGYKSMDFLHLSLNSMDKYDI